MTEEEDVFAVQDFGVFSYFGDSMASCALGKE
jgi:hypothetical protein